MKRELVLLTADEVAGIVRQSPESVRRWARDGHLPSITLPGGRIRFRQSDVDRLVLGEQVSPSGPTR
jgi:excisionase family DNA binding protein